MKFGYTFFSLVFALLPQWGYSQARRTAPQRQAPPAYMQQLKFFEENATGAKAVLKSGLTVLVSEYHVAPVVEVLTYVRTGRIDEPSDSPGISVVMGSMVYKATSTRGIGVIGKDTRALGGILLNSTDFDHSSFETVAPADQWKKALEIQADALLNPTLDPEELQHEIDSLIGKAKTGQDDADAFARGKLLRMAMQQPWAGTPSDEALRRISQAKLLAYYKTRYAAPRIILVICGDITTSETLNEVVRLYGKLGGQGEPPSPVEQQQDSFKYQEIRGDIQVPQVLLGFHTAPARSPDLPALAVLGAIVGKGDGSLLARRLRDRAHIIYGQETELLSNAQFGYLSFKMEVKPDAIDRSEIAALTELEILKREEPDDADLERGIALVEAQFWNRMQSVTGRANTLAHFESLGDWKRINEYVARLRQVKAEDVTRVAKKYLRLDNCSLLEYMPRKADPRDLSAETVRRTFQDLLAPSTDQEIEEREKETVPATDIPARTAAFKPSEVRYPLKTASVLRGPEIYIREDHSTPLIQMGFFFPGGKLLETGDKAGITYLMLRCILGGGKENYPGQFFRQMGVYGGQLQPVVREDYFGILFSILSSNVEKGFDLLGDRIKAPKFDKDEVAWQKALQLAELSREKDDPEDAAGQVIDRALFSGHPYALNAIGTQSTVSALTAEAVQEWYQKTVRNRKPIIVILGDTEGTSLAGYFVRHFSGTRFEEVKLAEVFPKPLDKKAVIDEHWEKNESMILMGFQAPPEGDEDSYPLTLFGNYFAGAGGRLADELMDRQRLAINVSCSYQPHARGGKIVFSATTLPGNEDKLSKALEGEVRHLIDNPLLYKDYRTAVNGSLGKVMIERQSRFGQIESITNSVLTGNGPEIFQGLPEHLKEVRQEDLEDVAKRIFKLDQAVTVRMLGGGK